MVCFACGLPFRLFGSAPFVLHLLTFGTLTRLRAPQLRNGRDSRPSAARHERQRQGHGAISFLPQNMTIPSHCWSIPPSYLVPQSCFSSLVGWACGLHAGFASGAARSRPRFKPAFPMAFLSQIAKVFVRVILIHSAILSSRFSSPRRAVVSPRTNPPRIDNLPDAPDSASIAHA
jgi:hypothetical protein